MQTFCVGDGPENVLVVVAFPEVIACAEAHACGLQLCGSCEGGTWTHRTGWYVGTAME